MGISGKLVSQVSVKYPKDDLFQLFKNPHQIAEISPQTVQSVDLLSGQWGTVGAVVFWNYSIDGKKAVGKEIIEAVDEEKKSMTYKVIEGDLMEFYHTFKITLTIAPAGEDNCLVTWSFGYEKKSEAVPDPHILMNYAMALTKQIERHHLLVPN